MRTIIGLVGPMKSGKGEFSKFLRQKGFAYFSLSDRVREEAKRKKLEPRREVLQDIGDSLRKKFGNDVLAKRTAKIIMKSDAPLVVIDSIRNPGEVFFLKKTFKAFIVGINASTKIRLKRYLVSAELDPKTPEAFFKASERDIGNEEKGYGQHVGACLKMADYIIENNGTLAEFKKKGTRLLKVLIP